MSADWWLMADEQQSYDDAHFNVTYNLGPMLVAAGWPTRERYKTLDLQAAPDRGNGSVCNWDVLKGTRAADLGEMVGTVVRNLESDPDRFRELNPPNGWGNYKVCLTEMRNFLAAIEQHPNARVEAWL